jgi:hypothetical protein
MTNSVILENQMSEEVVNISSDKIGEMPFYSKGVGEGAFTWKELAQAIMAMPEDRQEESATVFIKDSGECFGVDAYGPFERVDGAEELAGVLDEGHFILKV